MADRLGVALRGQRQRRRWAATSTRATGASPARSARCSPAASSPRTLTRSFLDTGPAYAETGWAIVSPAAAGRRRRPQPRRADASSRASTASALRAICARPGARPSVVPSARGARRPASPTAASTAASPRRCSPAQLAATTAGRSPFLPESLPRYRLVFGLWKGDLTLKRAIRSRPSPTWSATARWRTIFERYGVDPAKVAPAEADQAARSRRPAPCSRRSAPAGGREPRRSAAPPTGPASRPAAPRCRRLAREPGGERRHRQQGRRAPRRG